MSDFVKVTPASSAHAKAVASSVGGDAAAVVASVTTSAASAASAATAAVSSASSHLPSFGTSLPSAMAHLSAALSSPELHPLILPATFVLGLGTTMLFFALAVRHFSSPNNRHSLATSVTVLSLTATLMAVLMVPLDIFAVSTGELDVGDLRLRWEALEKLYDSLHVLLLTFAFVVVPFSYFYIEEDDADFDSDKSR